MIMRGLPSCRGRFGYASVLLGRIGQDFSGDAGEGLGEMVEEIGVPPTADESGDDLTAEAQDIGIVEAVVQRHGHILEVSGDVREHVVTVEVNRQPYISQRLDLEDRTQVVEVSRLRRAFDETGHEQGGRLVVVEVDPPTAVVIDCVGVRVDQAPGFGLVDFAAVDGCELAFHEISFGDRSAPRSMRSPSMYSKHDPLMRWVAVHWYSDSKMISQSECRASARLSSPPEPAKKASWGPKRRWPLRWISSMTAVRAG